MAMQTTRRLALVAAAAVAAPVLPAVAATTDPDAELFRLCAEYRDQTAALEGAVAGVTSLAAVTALHETMEEIAAIQALTPRGLVAKILVAEDRFGLDDEGNACDSSDAVVLAALRDTICLLASDAGQVRPLVLGGAA